MLLLLFRNCCRILWKPLNNHYKHHQLQPHHHHHHQTPLQQYIIWLFLLVLLSHQHGTHCRPTEKGNHRMQRRFMWKQMDSSVDGFVDRVVTGARVMKGMIGEFMPHRQPQGNVLDYLPTETTRVKYIIRNPHTKETKVIKIRPSKKVVKLMTMTSKPQMFDKHKTTHMLDPEKLRQLEREQELIAEGKRPMKHADRPTFMALTAEKQKDSAKDNTRLAEHDDSDIVSGSISEFGDSWKPVYKLIGETSSTGYSTIKPKVMSSLHTSVVDEMLPQPQKQIYEALHEDIDDYHEHDASKSHTYEVTEYTAEESVLQPYTHEYYTYKDLPLLSSLTLRGSPRHAPATEAHKADSNKHEEEEEDAEQVPEKAYVPEYRSQRGLTPVRTSYRSNVETTTAAAVTTSTTTTTEEPNYPASFLKKYRERPPESHYHAKLHNRNKPAEIALENSWLPSNISYPSLRVKPTLYHQSPSVGPRTKSQKWPPDVEETQSSASSYDVAVTTDTPTVLQEYATHTSLSLASSVRNTGNSRKNVRLKSHPHQDGGSTADADASTAVSVNTEYHRHRNVRQRGSIRFGDKLETE